MTSNAPLPGRREGGLIHITVPPPPHPFAAMCPTCRAHRGEPCRDLRKKSYPFREREKSYSKRPHAPRVAWAKKMLALDILLKEGPMRASEFGASLWPELAGCAPPQLARPAMNVLKELEKLGKVERINRRWGMYFQVKKGAW